MRKRVLTAICLGSLFIGLLGLAEGKASCAHAILILLGLSLIPACYKNLLRYLTND